MGLVAEPGDLEEYDQQIEKEESINIDKVHKRQEEFTNLAIEEAIKKAMEKEKNSEGVQNSEGDDSSSTGSTGQILPTGGTSPSLVPRREA